MLIPITTTLLFAGLATAATQCNADNCLRALRATQTPGRLESARAFCATYTQASVPSSAIPAYAVNACKANKNGAVSDRLSSACDCIAASTTSTTIASPTSTSSTAITTSSGSTSSGVITATTSPSVTLEACALVSSSSRAQKSTAPAGKVTRCNSRLC